MSQSSFSTLTCCILGLAVYEANRFTAYAMSGLVAFTSNCSAFRRRGRLCFGNALPFQLGKSIIFDTVGLHRPDCHHQDILNGNFHTLSMSFLSYL